MNPEKLHYELDLLAEAEFTPDSKPGQAAVCRKLLSNVGGARGLGWEGVLETMRWGRGETQGEQVLTGVTEHVCPPPASAPRTPRNTAEQRDSPSGSASGFIF